MSDDIKPCRNDYRIALSGVINHLKLTGIANGFDSFADAMYKLDMWDFVFNQADVMAYKEASIRRLYNILKPGIKNPELT